MSNLTSSYRNFSISRNSQSIDALRGYAILMVVAMHIISHVPSMIWPLKRLMLLGSNGVQLFFLASAITLLISWERNSESTPVARLTRFFINRFFRIAPLYFLAIAFYWTFYRSPLDILDFQKLLATMLFYNAWSPYLIPTVPGWMPVPGGWSISVEFSFYIIFPLLATTITNTRRAIFFIVVSYFLMILGFFLGSQLYQEIPFEARSRFLFFWPPNHLIIFSLGVLAYHAILSDKVRVNVEKFRFNSLTASLIVGFLIILLQFYPGSKASQLWFMPPIHVLLSITFLPWILAVILQPTKIIVSPAIIAIGKMSFSIYLVHFAVLPVAMWLLNKVWIWPLDGLMSVIFSAAAMLTTITLSYFFAKITYKYIERPFIQYGNNLSDFINDQIWSTAPRLEDGKIP